MRAVVLTAPEVLEMRDVEEPKAQPEEVILEVVVAGICGSDLHGIDGSGPRQPPLIMGHELVGRSLEGHLFAVNPILGCGRCSQCRAGRRNLCDDFHLLGIHRPGGFAERVSVPRDRLYPIPSGVTWGQAMMIEPIANGVHAWNLVDCPSDARIGLIGAGPIGLACLAAVKASGRNATVADPNDDRRRIAEIMGAAEARPELEGPFDVVIEAVGLAETRRLSISHLNPGGTAVWMGLIAKDPGFDAQELVRKELSLLGSFAYTDEEFEQATRVAGEFDFRGMEIVALDDGAGAFSSLATEAPKALKVGLAPGELPVSPSDPL